MIQWTKGPARQRCDHSLLHAARFEFWLGFFAVGRTHNSSLQVNSMYAFMMSFAVYHCSCISSREKRANEAKEFGCVRQNPSKWNESLQEEVFATNESCKARSLGIWARPLAAWWGLHWAGSILLCTGPCDDWGRGWGRAADWRGIRCRPQGLIAGGPSLDCAGSRRWSGGVWAAGWIQIGCVCACRGSRACNSGVGWGVGTQLKPVGLSSGLCRGLDVYCKSCADLLNSWKAPVDDSIACLGFCLQLVEPHDSLDAWEIDWNVLALHSKSMQAHCRLISNDKLRSSINAQDIQ